MASIQISDLFPAGSDLLADGESFLNELTQQEITDILGGGGITVQCSDFKFTAWW